MFEKRFFLLSSSQYLLGNLESLLSKIFRTHSLAESYSTKSALPSPVNNCWLFFLWAYRYFQTFILIHLQVNIALVSQR